VETSSPPAPSQPAFAERAGVSYALTAEGVKVPVIDVSHPSFEVADDPRSIESLRQDHAAMERRRGRLPRFLMRYMVRSAAKRSLLVRAMLAPPQGSVLPGMSTYLMKIGANNLVPPFDSDMDRRFAAFPGIVSIRIRLQQTARLLARALEPQLAARTGATLHLLNIGGGSAIDSLNALILLRRASAALLQREIVIHVLDPDTNGPLFAARALAALGGERAPLAGVGARLIHTPYDWTKPAPLRELVRKLAADDAIVAASSEGALFEYGSDASVVANLEALHDGGGGACWVAGSVTRADAITRQTLQSSPFKLIPRGAQRFAELIRGSGFSVAKVEESLHSDQVLLQAG
jgi:hypothetical protein